MTKETMQEAARAVHDKLPDYGFILLVVPFNKGEETDVQYTSNCNREDAVKVIKNILFRWGINDEWMKDAK